MQFDPRRARCAHQRDLLPGTDVIAFLHQPLAVVAVGRQERVVVLDDDQLAVTNQAVAAVHHRAWRSGSYWITHVARDVETGAIAAAARFESADDFAVRGPLPGDAAGAAGRTGRWRRH